MAREQRTGAWGGGNNSGTPPYHGPVRRSPALALVFATAAVLSACSSSHPQAKTSPIPAVNATTAPGLPTTANALPDVTPAQLQHLLSALHGTPVVVNVWGSWCGPCRLEGPKLAAAARRYGDRIQFVGLDVKDSRPPAQAFIRQMGWTYPSLFDPTPNAEAETQTLGFFAQPVTVFYDRDGHQADQVSGPVTAATLAAGIAKIVG
jgi:thiol-disulfide isomerase/thioredoxin